MRVLTIAGKVDTRVLVYPLARALSLTGLTAVVTDDGAYRRLFKGKGLKGTVSGIDVSVGLNMDIQLKNSLAFSGIPYDNLIVVSSNYIPKDSDGVIICHGVDDSMGADLEDNIKDETEEVRPKPKKKKLGFGKKAVNEQEDETIEVDESTNSESELNNEAVNDIEEDNDDSFDIPEGIPVTEIFISYNKPLDKYERGLLLKDGYMQYIYSCEERKLLERFMDKSINKYIASLVAPVIDIDIKELEQLLIKQEYAKDTKKSRK